MENNKENKINLNKDTLKKVIVVLAVLVGVILIFGAGVFVGEMKARFSYRWAENYQRNFAGPAGGFLGNLGFPRPAGGLMESHGVFGQIMKIDGSTFVIRGQNNMEQIVLVESDTIIRNPVSTIKISDLKVGDSIVVIGNPNDSGQIQAKFVRLIPAPPSAGTSSQSMAPSAYY